MTTLTHEQMLEALDGLAGLLAPEAVEAVSALRARREADQAEISRLRANLQAAKDVLREAEKRAQADVDGISRWLRYLDTEGP